MTFAGPISDCGGIYIHVPFCRHKCGYCDFYSVTDQQLQTEYVAAVVREIERRTGTEQGLIFDTIYLGGGTPSLLKSNEIESIITSCYKHLQMADACEISIEANPESTSAATARDWRSIGINRVSLGVQSFMGNELQLLGRIHDTDAIDSAYNNLRKAGFSNVNFDLISALPGQTEAQLNHNLQAAIARQPEHISLYTLIIEENTPFWEKRRNGELIFADEGQELSAYLNGNDLLAKAGYEQYEISNYSTSAATRSRHNLKYWQYLPYLGFGPAAHSFIRPRRSHNLRSIRQYLSKIAAGALPEADREILGQGEQMEEYIYTGLRLRSGVDCLAFQRLFGRPPEGVFPSFLCPICQFCLPRIDALVLALAQ
jgi:oxygen-independent coproporphyrinogen-3 oxidase